MIYCSVIVALKDGRRHAHTWTDFGDNVLAVTKAAERKFKGMKVLGHCYDQMPELVRCFTDTMLKPNEEIVAKIKAEKAGITALQRQNFQKNLEKNASCKAMRKSTIKPKMHGKPTGKKK